MCTFTFFFKCAPFIAYYRFLNKHRGKIAFLSGVSVMLPVLFVLFVAKVRITFTCELSLSYPMNKMRYIRTLEFRWIFSWGMTNIRNEGMNCNFWSGLRNELRFWSGLKEWIAILGLDWRNEIRFWSRLRNELQFLAKIEEWIGMWCMFVVTQHLSRVQIPAEQIRFFKWGPLTHGVQIYESCMSYKWFRLTSEIQRF